MKSELQKEFVGADIEGLCQSHQDFYRGSAFATFDPSDIVWMDVGFFSKSLLAQPCLRPALENRFANDLALKLLQHSDNGNKIQRNAPHTQRVGCCFVLAYGKEESINANQRTAFDLRDSEYERKVRCWF
jgi:hypothetical protein